MPGIEGTCHASPWLVTGKIKVNSVTPSVLTFFLETFSPHPLGQATTTRLQFISKYIICLSGKSESDSKPSTIQSLTTNLQGIHWQDIEKCMLLSPWCSLAVLRRSFYEFAYFFIVDFFEHHVHWNLHSFTKINAPPIAWLCRYTAGWGMRSFWIYKRPCICAPIWSACV